MRLTFVLPAWYDVPIGGYRVVYEYSNLLAQRGHTVSIIYPKKNVSPNERKNKEVKSLFIEQVEYYRSIFYTPKITWFPLSTDVKLIIAPTLAAKYIPVADAVIATSWHTAEWVALYPEDKGGKFYLVQNHEIWSGSEDQVNNTFKLPLYKIAISKWLEELLATFDERINIFHIPNAIDIKFFTMTKPIATRDPMRIGMLYHEHWYKGSKVGIDALKIIKDKYQQLQAVFFSTYPRGKDVPEWVQFYQNPPQETLMSLYNSFSIFICPGLIEGWALPPAEAMACGCALVSTDIGGVKDYAIHGKTALLSPAKDSKALAQNILKLIDDNELRIEIASKGNEIIKTFSWNDSGDKLEYLLKSKINRSR